MKQFHIRSGADVCYPITMLETLLAELEAVKRSQASLRLLLAEAV